MGGVRDVGRVELGRRDQCDSLTCGWVGASRWV